MVLPRPDHRYWTAADIEEIARQLRIFYDKLVPANACAVFDPRGTAAAGALPDEFYEIDAAALCDVATRRLYVAGLAAVKYSKGPTFHVEADPFSPQDGRQTWHLLPLAARYDTDNEIAAMAARAAGEIRLTGYFALHDLIALAAHAKHPITGEVRHPDAAVEALIALRDLMRPESTWAEREIVRRFAPAGKAPPLSMHPQATGAWHALAAHLIRLDDDHPVKPRETLPEPRPPTVPPPNGAAAPEAPKAQAWKLAAVGIAGAILVGGIALLAGRRHGGSPDPSGGL